MRRPRIDGNFFIALLINIIFNFEGSIPAWILLVLHFVFGLSVKWFWIALGIWLGGLILWMIIVGKIYGWANKCGNTPIRRKRMSIRIRSVRRKTKSKNKRGGK